MVRFAKLGNLQREEELCAASSLFPFIFPSHWPSALSCASRWGLRGMGKTKRVTQSWAALLQTSVSSPQETFFSHPALSTAWSVGTAVTLSHRFGASNPLVVKICATDGCSCSLLSCPVWQSTSQRLFFGSTVLLGRPLPQTLFPDISETTAFHLP